MNKEELARILKKENIDQRFYSLTGPTDTRVGWDAYVLEENYGIWEVYFYERGHKENIRKFKSESEACEYFLKYILEDSVIKRQR
jgi:hypothetical protein